jgi:hypothetical protein
MTVQNSGEQLADKREYCGYAHLEYIGPVDGAGRFDGRPEK